MKVKAASFSLDDGTGKVLEGTDADFGIAAWQLEDLWRKLEVRMSKRIAAEEDEEVDLGDAEYGLSEEQVAEVMEKKIVEEALTDNEDESDGNDSDFGLSTVQLDSFSKPNSFPIEDSKRVAFRPWSWHVEGRSACKLRESRSFPAQSLSQVRVALLSTRQINDVTWYLFEVRDGASTTYFAKRYSDFVQLDKDLRRSAKKGGSVTHVPELPSKIPLAIFQAFLMEGFDKRREDGLRRFVETVVAQVKSVEDEPALQYFFGSTALGGVKAKQGTPARLVS